MKTMKINILRAFWNFEVNELSTASGEDGGGGKSYDRPGRQKKLLRHCVRTCSTYIHRVHQKTLS